MLSNWWILCPSIDFMQNIFWTHDSCFFIVWSEEVLLKGFAILFKIISMNCDSVVMCVLIISGHCKCEVITFSGFELCVIMSCNPLAGLTQFVEPVTGVQLTLGHNLKPDKLWLHFCNVVLILRYNVMYRKKQAKSDAYFLLRIELFLRFSFYTFFNLYTFPQCNICTKIYTLQ